MPPDPSPYHNLTALYGDLHNHCNLSYGHGSFEDAIQNARMQLDFASITLHALWPDMPEDDPDLDYLVAYHKYGFAQAAVNWPGYLQKVQALNRAEDLILFPSYEWHSNAYGDHCIYYRDDGDHPILDAPTLPALREKLLALETPALLIPHHIGYRQGFRGIDWSAFSPELSPVVEILSFHGASESSSGPRPYLHSMGPRHGLCTAQAGWSRGHIFGVIGSTDGHSAFPGSYGRGRLAVWAEGRTRSDIWQALHQRRTVALTGDRIEVQFSLNGEHLGSICPPDEERRIQVSIHGGDAIDLVEVLHNNRPIHRAAPLPPEAADGPFSVHLEVGWGERPRPTDWTVEVQVVDGRLGAIEPRFRGFVDKGMPDDHHYAYTHWERTGPNTVRFTTRTRPNPNPLTPAMEGMAFILQGDENTRLQAAVNGQVYEHSLGELLEGNRTHYMGGFVSPAVCFHQAAPAAARKVDLDLTHRQPGAQRDWYTVRVRQRNEQWAWTSPIWVAGKNNSGDGAGAYPND